MIDLGIAGHMANLDHIETPMVRNAYLALMMVTSACGLEARVRTGAGDREVQFRDADARQPFSALVLRDRLIFSVRRPVLDLMPSLAHEAARLFGDRVEDAPMTHDLAVLPGEVRIRLVCEADVEALAEGLLPPRRLVSLGGPARRRA